MNVDDLLAKLFSLTCEGEFRGIAIIGRNDRSKVESAVREWATENGDKKDAIIASLEAKITVYEAVIGNSNFAPLIAPIVDKPEDDCK